MYRSVPLMKWLRILPGNALLYGWSRFTVQGFVVEMKFFFPE